MGDPAYSTNRWEHHAYRVVAERFPAPHVIHTHQPRARAADQEIVGDFGVYLGEDLVAVVEVGDLTRPDKLDLWEQLLLPGTIVWWLPKADLIHLVSPATARFRFALPEPARDALQEQGRLYQRLAAAVDRERAAVVAASDAVKEAQVAIRQAGKALRMADQALVQWLLSGVDAAIETRDRREMQADHKLPVNGEPADG